MKKILSKWAEEGSHYLFDCMELAQPYLDANCENINKYLNFVSRQLFLDCHLTSESSLLLISFLKEWDADLLSRAVLEGTMKYVFMMSGSVEQQIQKAREYWEILPVINAKKRENRIKNFVEYANNQDDVLMTPFRDILNNSDKSDLKYDEIGRTERQRIEFKWSFAGMMKVFSETDGLRSLMHLSYTYGMTSHLIHKDGDGVGIVFERFTREPDKFHAVVCGHAARIISDLCSFAKVRCLFLLNTCNAEVSLIESLDNNYNTFFEDLRNAYNQFIYTEYGFSPVDNL